ncbi:MAG: RNB domain-containing ribonuclease [Sulfuriferula sp.]|nr:RNB domain-containing ribonuclease [Sulfuriferula sp.]
MYLLYEEDGHFKAGTIVADNDSSLQVDSQHGKRLKVKALNIMMRFAAPTPAELMTAAQQVRDDTDTDFLWEVASQEEFGFVELATEYFGHVPTPIESAGILMRLHESPMHFYKKGRGRYKAAPADALVAAKAGMERRAREAEALAMYVAELMRFALPDALSAQVDELLYAPDKNQIAWKAIDAACKQTGLTPVKLLHRCGAVPSTHDYHLQVFLREQFPRGVDFAESASLPATPDLPVATVAAFSIDDASTTEIDDAFSVTPLANGNTQVGVHIAAPALGLLPDTEMDKVAAQRLSTVYYPGGKITMLPATLVDNYTLSAGRVVPALSMYIEVGADYQVVGQYTKLEAVPIVANLRHECLEQDFNHNNLVAGCPAYPYQDELTLLWHLSGTLEAGRGKTPDPKLPVRADYNFKVENDKVTITDRLRGNPIDRVVSELMIFVNANWGKWLADTETMALYRTQQNGKVKMSAKPGPHVGLGVEQYTWSSSPLRRYIDLVNQRQLIALALGVAPPYPPKASVLYTVLRDFELAYDAYNDFQRKMERYWCLRWLQQEGVTTINASIIKENLVRLDGLPFVTRVPSLPELPVATRVNLIINIVDLLEVELMCDFHHKIDEPVAEAVCAG